MAEKSKPATLAIIGKVRFSYAHVWEPQPSNDGKDPKYNVSLIIPKKNKELIAKIEKAIEAARSEGIINYGEKWGKKLKLPLRDGDEDREDAAYENSMFINASSKSKPGIVDIDKDPIIDKDEFYSGCYGYASVNFYPYNKESNGIGAGLNNLMKTADGEKLAGRTSATEDFADIDDEDLM